MITNAADSSPQNSDAQSGQNQAATDKRRTSILILDDEPIVCKRLKPFFQRAGYEVEAYNVPAEAVAKIETRPFDIVISDLKMEGLDGLTFVGKVKSLYPDSDVIIITGFATMEVARESFHKGVFDFVAKPFKLADILDCVRRVEAKRGLAKNM